MIYESDTFQPVDDHIDLSGPYHDAIQLMSTATSRIYRISKAGKTMLLKTPVDDSGRKLELLKREYNLGVGLSHQHVAAIYTWEDNSPVGPGILMEYVDGRTLASFLTEHPPMNARKRVFEQLLAAVNYIHKHGITHNDLKPGNIMVTRANDDVKIIDFGLADSDGETCRRQLGGTPGYASPELSERDGAADMRSDIFSIGAIMYDIFGNRYRRLWRKCMAEKPQRRYRNIDSLCKAWHRRKKMPMMILAFATLLLLGGILVSGTLKMEGLRQKVEVYSQSSRQMADTIAALRQSQTDASDSISRLNNRLYVINRDKELTDSITEAYLSSALNLIEKYKGITRKMRCVEETFKLYDLYYVDMDKNDSLFLRQNPYRGRDIFDKYGTTMRMRGASEIEACGKELPSIYDMTSDGDELSRVVPLILSGQPWSLQSDSARIGQ